MFARSAIAWSATSASKDGGSLGTSEIRDLVRAARSVMDRAADSSARKMRSSGVADRRVSSAAITSAHDLPRAMVPAVDRASSGRPRSA